jgi:hypothetical protein
LMPKEDHFQSSVVNATVWMRASCNECFGFFKNRL